MFVYVPRHVLLLHNPVLRATKSISMHLCLDNSSYVDQKGVPRNEIFWICNDTCTGNHAGRLDIILAVDFKAKEEGVLHIGFIP